jgi:MFS family permease
MVSLKDRFHFQSAGYGRFMSMIGLFLALSQGSARFVLDFVARLDTVHAQRNRVRLLALCFFTVACARFLVYQTLHLGAIYTLFAVMVTAMGIATTILSADSQRVAAPDELGSFFGLQSALENAAGMAGPLVGGILSNMHRRQYAVQAPLAAVLLLNMVVVLLVAFRYESTVLKTSSEMKAKAD